MSKEKNGTIYVRQNKIHGTETKERVEAMSKEDKVSESDLVRSLINTEYDKREKRKRKKIP